MPWSVAHHRLSGQRARERQRAIPSKDDARVVEVMGFRRFSLRGHAKVSLEWTLVCVSYNLKRLLTLKNLATLA